MIKVNSGVACMLCLGMVVHDFDAFYITARDLMSANEAITYLLLMLL